MPIRDYEDVTVYGLDADQETELLAKQNECTFCWTTRDGSPMAVTMSYVYHQDRFWLTASGQRKRVPAVRRDGRVAVVITSSGTDVGPGRTVSYKGTARVLDDAVSKEWFYPALAERLVGHLGPARRRVRPVPRLSETSHPRGHAQRKGRLRRIQDARCYGGSPRRRNEPVSDGNEGVPR